MDRSLWLLMWLRLRGWFRRTGRMVRTVKGAVLAFIGLVVFALMFVPIIVAIFIPNEARSFQPQNIERYGVMILLLYSALALSTSAAEKAISFSPAEVNWLFPAPLSRRQLLIYKLVIVILGGLALALFLGAPLRLYAHSTTAAIVGLFAVFLFLQLQGMIVALLTATAGELFSRRNRLILVGFFGAGVIACLFAAGGGELPATWDAAADAIDNAPVLRTLLAPLKWFVQTFTARQLWPDLARYGGLALGFDLTLIILVLLADAAFLEASAAASERNFNRLQLLRSGGMAAVWTAGTKAKFTLPSLPHWRGIGPVAWRQLLGLMRGLKGLTVFIVLVSAPAAWPLLSSTLNDMNTEFRVGMVVAPLSILFLVAPSLLTFDFRGDIDRMDILKSLPVATPWLVLGQLLAPVAFMTLLQVFIAIVVQVGLRSAAWILPLVIVFAIPLNFIFVAMENLLFLLFPTRMAVGVNVDLQSMGRQLVYWLLKMIVLGVALGVAGLAAWGTLALTESRLYAASAAWWLLVAFDGLMMLPLCGAFEDFDVARDTPP